MKDNPIEPLDIEFDDILTPQPVREEPAKEEPTKEVEPVAEIKPADIEDSETEDVDEPVDKVEESPLRVEPKDEETDTVETLDSLFERFPTVQKHLEYVQQGGDPNEFMKAFTPETDYSRIEIKEDDTASQKRILTDYFVARGTEKDFIGDMLESYEDKGTLKHKAEAGRSKKSECRETDSN